MRDRLFIFTGLAIFLALVTLPFWYRTSAALSLHKPQGTKCIVDRRSHMQALETRRIERRENASVPFSVPFSLTGTCLAQCHGNKDAFCDRCHAYVGLNGPYCWDCHQGSAQ